VSSWLEPSHGSKSAGGDGFLSLPLSRNPIISLGDVRLTFLSFRFVFAIFALPGGRPCDRPLSGPSFLARSASQVKRILASEQLASLFRPVLRSPPVRFFFLV